MRLLLKIFDYILAIIMGLAAVWLVSLIVGSGWNMFAAMFAGMFIGMLVVFPVLMFSCGISTAFHVMPVGMLVTMFSGMLAGMTIAMNTLSTSQLYPLAILIAATVQIYIDIYDMRLKGEVPVSGR